MLPDDPSEHNDGRSKQKPHRLRILVVEDIDDSRELMVGLLHQTGEHTITDVATAEEGLERLRGEAYDLIVTDIGLPGMSGLEMLDQATREGLLPGPDIVVCSADVWLRSQVVERGGRYLPKPVELSQIRDAVRSIAAPSPRQ